jgi:Mrp family chromosome partitioning ATPase
MDLHEYPRMLRRRWFVIVAVTAIGLALAWVTLPSSSAEKQAAKRDVSFKSTVVLVAPEGTKPDLQKAALYATRGPVPNGVAQSLGVKVGSGAGAAGAANAATSKKGGATTGAQQTVQIGSTNVVARPDAASGSLNIIASDKDKLKAPKVAGAIAAALVTKEKNDADARHQAKEAVLRLASDQTQVALNYASLAANATPAAKADRSLQSTLAQMQKNHTDAQDKLTTFQNNGPAAPPLGVLSPANTQRFVKKSNGLSAPTSRGTRLILGGGLGLLLGLGLALILERLDSHVRNAPTAEKLSQLPVIAEIPHVRVRKHNRAEILSMVAPKSQYAEAYRGLRTSISLMSMAHASGTLAVHPNGDDSLVVTTEPQVILVTSPGANEGKTTTSANLATTYAGMGASVIVVDLDFRRQKLFRMLGAQPGPHLTNEGELGGELRVDLSSVIQPSNVPGVRFVPSAPRDAMPEHALRLARAAISAARKSADVVILDGPPLLLTNDVRELVPYVDAVVLLAREGRTQRRALGRASQLLRRIDAPVVGLAFIGSHGSRREYGYGDDYGYGYGYGYRQPRQPRKARKGAKAAAAPPTIEDTVISLEDPPDLDLGSDERRAGRLRAWPRR